MLRLVPPVGALYHFTTPGEAVALKPTVPVPHLLPPVVPVSTGLVTIVNVPVAAAEPVTEPVDTVRLPDDKELTEIVRPATGVEVNVGTIKK